MMLFTRSEPAAFTLAAGLLLGGAVVTSGSERDAARATAGGVRVEIR